MALFAPDRPVSIEPMWRDTPRRSNRSNSAAYRCRERLLIVHFGHLINRCHAGNHAVYRFKRLSGAIDNRLFSLGKSPDGYLRLEYYSIRVSPSQKDRGCGTGVDRACCRSIDPQEPKHARNGSSSVYRTKNSYDDILCHYNIASYIAGIWYAKLASGEIDQGTSSGSK